MVLGCNEPDLMNLLPTGPGATWQRSKVGAARRVFECQAATRDGPGDSPPAPNHALPAEDLRGATLASTLHNV